ncbi:hypothetical protein AOLI_G00190040 [Acnodon oligacanthus]
MTTSTSPSSGRARSSCVNGAVRQRREPYSLVMKRHLLSLDQMSAQCTEADAAIDHAVLLTGPNTKSSYDARRQRNLCVPTETLGDRRVSINMCRTCQLGMPGEDTTTRPGTLKPNRVTSGTSPQEREAAALLLTGNDKQLQGRYRDAPPKSPKPLPLTGKDILTIKLRNNNAAFSWRRRRCTAVDVVTNRVTAGIAKQEQEMGNRDHYGYALVLTEDDNAPLPHAAHCSTPSPEQHNIPTLTNQDTHTHVRTPAL